MNKVINGRKYDTKTAKQICCRSNQCGNGLPGSYDTLYLKKTGEFFLCHEATGQMLYDMKDYITPVSEEEAKEFVAAQMDADGYESIFGEVEE